MLFSWHQPQRNPKHHRSAVMPGEEEGCVSKQTGHLGSAKIRALLQLSTCSQGSSQPKHRPACQPSGEWDEVGRDTTSASHDGSMVPTQAEVVTARPAALRGRVFCPAPPAPGTPWHHGRASSTRGSSQTAPWPQSKRLLWPQCMHPNRAV